MTRTAAVFDMDGVLVDNAPLHRAAWRQLCVEEQVTLPDGEWWRLTIGRPIWEALPRLLGPLDEARLVRLAGRRQALYEELAARGLVPVAGVVDFVRQLTAGQIPCAIATSAIPENVSPILTTLGLADVFPVRVTAADIRRGKPDPEVYATAAARLGVSAAACVVFEDAVTGVEAARRAGMAVIGVTTAHPAGELLAAGAARAVPDFRGLTWGDVARL